jgi:hypothetical protein
MSGPDAIMLLIIEAWAFLLGVLVDGRKGAM